MVIFESHATAWLYHRKPECELLAAFVSAARWVLILYLGARFADLFARQQSSLLVARDWRSVLFWAELAIMALAPVALSLSTRIRKSRLGQWATASLVVFGVVLNRIDVGGVAHPSSGGDFYVPAWREVAITVGVISAAILAFLFIVERFKVWEQRPADPQEDPLRPPDFDPVGNTWLGVPEVAARTMYSLAFILAAAFGFGLLHLQASETRGVEPTPVHRARGGDVLWIDGNLDGFGVAFKHAEHEKREGGKQSCVKCHHMNVPRDEGSSCARCHLDMYLPSDSFRHDWHASAAGGRVACYQCHVPGKERTAATAVTCDKCHKNLVPAGASIKVKQYQAMSYSESLHRLCLGCHVHKAKEKNKPEMLRCDWCHKDNRDVIDSREIVLRRRGLNATNLLLPPPDATKQ